eukprot:scaffold8182_cov120-Isochrysis_galbana.AAC.4
MPWRNPHWRWVYKRQLVVKLCAFLEKPFAEDDEGYKTPQPGERIRIEAQFCIKSIARTVPS